MMVIFAILLGSSSRDEVMQHWGKRRCDIDVLLASAMFKPDDDTRTSSAFASDNFNFCVGELVTKQLTTLYAPLFGSLQAQMGSADVFSEIMGTLREQMKNIFTPFTGLMGSNWVKFKQIGSLFSRIFQQLYMAMKKAAGIAVAAMYVGISLLIGMLNAIDFTLNVIIIILYIIFALAILYYAPVIPAIFFIILATVGIELAFPGRLGGKGFCFAPDTPIVMSDSTVKPINTIKKGDILKDGGVVETVQIVKDSQEDLYLLDGILVTGTHRVWYEEKQEFINVSEHPEATLTDKKLVELWDLSTTTNKIPVKGLSRTITFSDWEDLPQHWCFVPETPIVVYSGEVKPISSIGLGEILRDGSIVEAVLQFPGEKEMLYDFFGVKVSGLHKVWSYKQDKYISIKDHHLATKTTLTVPVLWSLITSKRSIIAKGTNGLIRFADWEELPASTAEGWDYIVRSQINTVHLQKAPVPRVPPCLDEGAWVLRYREDDKAEYILLGSVQAGDVILDSFSTGKRAKVIGLCKRRVEGGFSVAGLRMTDGIWIRGDFEWVHPTGILDTKEWDGVQLVTDSGSFTIHGVDKEDQYTVRDFTEVGISRLSATYLIEEQMFPG
jgi:hypothetical protein